MSTIQLAPHLQRALDSMSKDLAIEPQALVNQAVFAWLRINGYVLPGAAGHVVVAAPSLAVTPPSASDAALRAVEEPVAPVISRASPVPMVAPATASTPAHVPPPRAPEPPPPAPPPPEPVIAAVPPVPAVVAPAVTPESSTSVVPAATPSTEAPHQVRMKEIAADLKLLSREWPDWVAPEPQPEPEVDEDEEEEAPQDEVDDEPAPQDEPAPEEEDDAPVDVDEPQPPPEDEPVAEDEPAPQAVDEEEDEALRSTSIRMPQQEPEVDDHTGESEVDDPPPESTVVLRSVPIVLYLERENEEPVRVESERFIIGRGPTCDLIIDSPRVSREHVVIKREGIQYFLEDLNSSNGTWMGEERIQTRELEDGDVIILGNEPVTFSLRGA